MAKHLEPENPSPAGRSPIWRRIGMIAAIVVIGFVSVIAGFSIFQHKSIVQVLAEPFVQTPQQVFGKDNLRVLVIGLDYDYTDKDQEYSTAARSDVIKAVNLDFDQKRVYVLSVLRDMVATLPNGRQAKINEAQSDGGIKESSAVIASFLGVPGFDRYVILRAESMRDIINAIGGVEVDVKDSDCLQNHECKGQSALNYDDNWGHLHIHLKPGVQHLDGDQAVGYARFRHDWCSDPCRSMRQDQVIDAIISEIKGNKFNTAMHLPQLIDFMRRNVTTNLTQAELISLGSYFIDINLADIKKAQVAIADNIMLPDGSAAILPDQTKLKQQVREMLVAPPTPQPSPDSIALLSIPPNSIKIDVENGSGIKGAAHLVASALKAKGFLIGDVGNAPENVDETEIHEHSKTTFAGQKVRVALPTSLRAANVFTDDDSPSTATSDVTVVVGKDLALATAAAAAPGTAVPTPKI